jgi:uncharacterized protein YkwD
MLLPMTRSRRARWIAPCVAMAALAPGLAGEDPVADRVVEHLQGARVEAGVDSLRRRGDLDAVARERARTIAALPHDRRLEYEQTAGEALRAADIRWFSRAAAHLDMVRGYTRPEIGFMRSWENHSTAWDRALSGDYTSIGVASHRADDGWVIFVALLVEELELPEDLRQVEQEMVRVVNDLRAEHGVGRLTASAELTTVARLHSEDMVARGYLDHVNPEGLGPSERVNLAGIDFEKLSENIASNRGHKQPARHAVEQWLGSPGHRASMLDPEFEMTGVGVALGKDGLFCFTQLYLRDSPPQ